MYCCPLATTPECILLFPLLELTSANVTQSLKNRAYRYVKRYAIGICFLFSQTFSYSMIYLNSASAFVLAFLSVNAGHNIVFQFRDGLWIRHFSHVSVMNYHSANTP